MLVNRAELSRILGVAQNTITNKVDNEGMPFVNRPGEDGGIWQFETVDVIAWLVNGGKAPQESPRDRAELREREAIASLKELELGQRQKVLVHVDDVVRVINEKYSVIKSRITALPARVAQLVSAESDPAVCRKILKDEVNQVLTTISEDFTREQASAVGESA